MKVFLIGLPGCGKSTIGKRLAGALNRPLVDMDREIEKSSGLPVVNIFAKYGESHFRKIETQILSYWCAQKHDFVLATGGGTPCFFSNMDIINKTGISIFLDTPVEEIARRMLQTEMAKRPLFAGQDESTIASRVSAMRKERLPFYLKARLTFSNSFVLEDLVAKIKQLEGEAHSQ